MGAALRSCILSLLVGLQCAGVYAQDIEILNIAEEHNLAGLSVVTRCGGEISTEAHFGFRDIGRKLPVTPTTTFRIASISKAAVALLAAKLAEEGTLAYNAPLSAYLDTPPQHPGHPAINITVEQLLSHTSGIRDGTGYGDFLTATYASAPDAPLLEEVLSPNGAYYSSNMWGPQAPGAHFQYANLNFGVLATVMEAATGWRFDQLFQAWLAGPYGLDAGFRVQDLSDINALAVLYRQENGQWTAQADEFLGVMPEGPDWSTYYPGTNAVGFAPQGGLRISARDLGVLTQLWTTGAAQGADGQPLQFLSAAALSDLHAPQWSYNSANGGNGNNYGGLFNMWSRGLHLADSGLGADQVIPDAGVAPFLGHPGEAYGLISDAYGTPDGHWNMTLVTNGKWEGYSPGASSAFYRVEEDIFAALRDDLLQCTAQSHDRWVAPQASAMAGPVRPGDSTLRVHIPLALNPPLRFTILDATGQQLQEGQSMVVEGGVLTLPLPHLSAGLHVGTVVPAEGNSGFRFLFWVLN